MIHTEDCESCSVNKGNEMHGFKAEQSTSTDTKMFNHWKKHAEQHQQDLCMEKIQSTILQGYPMIAVYTEQELDIQRPE